MPKTPANNSEEWGLDPALFGKDPSGGAIDADSLVVRAPSLLTFRLPAELASGCELVATGVLDEDSGAEGSVQLEVVAGKPPHDSGLILSPIIETVANGPWTSNNRRTSFATPIIVNDNSKARERIASAFDDFRRLFPAALCYTKIVPVDEVVTLTLFYREDDQLVRLMLDEAQAAQLEPALGRAALRQPRRADAGRRLRPVDGIRHAGRRSEGVRAASQANQRPGRRVPKAPARNRAEAPRRACSNSRRGPTAAR